MKWWFVYILKSTTNNAIYIGSTNNVERRLTQHNQGLNQSTKKGRPWELIAFISIPTEIKARSLEKYFKSGSGKAILKNRIINSD